MQFLFGLRNNGDNTSTNSTLDSAYIDIAGFRAGLFYSWWDDDLSREPDILSSFKTLHNSNCYRYESVKAANSTPVSPWANWQTATTSRVKPE